MSDEAIDLLAREGLRLASPPAHTLVSECTPATPLPFAPDDPAAPFGHGPAPAFEAILDAVEALDARLARLESAVRAIPPPAPIVDLAPLVASVEALAARIAALEERLAIDLAAESQGLFERPIAATIDAKLVTNGGTEPSTLQRRGKGKKGRAKRS